MLAEAAAGRAASVPLLTDLVKAPSRLPSWMTAPADLETTTKTHEVATANPLPDSRSVRWMPWQERQKQAVLPTTPGSSVQTIFGSKVVVPRDPNAVVLNTFHYGKEFFAPSLLLVVLGCVRAVSVWRIKQGSEFFGGDSCVTIACFIYGMFRAVEESRAAQRLGATARHNPLNLHTTTSLFSPLPAGQTKAGSSLPRMSFIGNRVLSIYHLRDCDWVQQISNNNVVGFKSPTDALSHGYKPCRICSPAA